MTYHDPHAAEEALGAAMLALTAKEGHASKMPFTERPNNADRRKRRVVVLVDEFLSDGEWRSYADIIAATGASHDAIAKNFSRGIKESNKYERRKLRYMVGNMPRYSAEWRLTPEATP